MSRSIKAPEVTETEFTSTHWLPASAGSIVSDIRNRDYTHAENARSVAMDHVRAGEPGKYYEVVIRTVCVGPVEGR